MALKATIFKAELAVADMDRNVYADFSLTLARHPSENDERMMIRLLAFMLYADEALSFGKGLCSDEEPDLWEKDLTGAIKRWIMVGQLDERWLRKAEGRAEHVVVLSYGGRVAEMWWDQNRPTLEKLSNLTVMRIPQESVQALGALANRNMQLQSTIQEGEVLITGGDEPVRIEPVHVFGAPVAT